MPIVNSRQQGKRYKPATNEGTGNAAGGKADLTIGHVATCPSARAKNADVVTPSDTSMSVRGREWHQYVGVCGKQQRERGRRGKGLSARRVLVVAPRRTSK